MNVSNGSTVTVQIDITYYLYIGFGSTAVVANVLIILVLLTNKEYLKKSAFIFGLAIGDFLTGATNILLGVKRIEWTLQNIINLSVHPLVCWKSFTVWALVGLQLSSIMMFLIGVERFVAVVMFSWYYHNWKNRMAWLLTSLGFAFCALSILASLIIVYSMPNNATTTMQCTTPFVVSSEYSSYNYGVAIVCRSTAIGFTLASLIAFIRKRQKFQPNQNMNLQKFVTKQWQTTVSMMCLTVMDFIMVVLPYSIIILVAFIPTLLTLAYVVKNIIVLRSALSIFIYVFFNKEFSGVFFKIFGITKKSSQTVTPGTEMTRSKIDQKD